ncbi:MAG: DUF4143 domain-containing protein [Lachnospiraceae bacterium]
MKANDHDLYYWFPDSPPAEVDFVIQAKGRVLPLEVKYDQNVHARSMKHYMNMSRRK